MSFFRKDSVSDPHAGRRVPLQVKAGQSPASVVKSAIWTLIQTNCDPPRSFNTARVWDAREDPAPVSDVSVQTFYLVFPPSTFDTYGAVRGDEISEGVIREMIQMRLETFEDYLSNKIGASVWNQATADDRAAKGAQYFVQNAKGESKGSKEIKVHKGVGRLRVNDVVTFAGSPRMYVVREPLNQDEGTLRIEPGLVASVAENTEIAQVIYESRVNATKIARLIEVLRCPVESITEPCVVGRESLAVEVVRLRDQGKDPRVIAQVYVSGSAHVNPHIRESQRTQHVGRGDTICVIEGRAANVFFIGANTYDDIQVEGMPPDAWYQLRVLSPDQMPVSVTVADRTGQQIAQTSTRPDTWRLGDQAQHGWSCALQIMKPLNATISQVTGLPELPPSIKLIGRVLPKGFAPPQELLAHLSLNSITCKSAVNIEKAIYVYVSDDDNSYIVDIDGASGLTASTQEVFRHTYPLEERTSVTVGRLRYVWLTNGLPANIIGQLAYERSDDCPAELMPVAEQVGSRWVIGREYKREARLQGDPLFVDNIDPYLSRSGNAVIEHSETDPQGYPIFKLMLLPGREVGLFIRSAAGGDWQSGPWAWPLNSEAERQIPGVELNGVSNRIIMGTSYFDVATRHTLRPIQ